MSFRSKLLFTLSILLFTNSAYSSYQVTQLSKISSAYADIPETTTTESSESSLPVDIILETILASLFSLLGAVCEAIDTAATSSSKSEDVKKISELIGLNVFKPIEYSKATSEFEVEKFGIFDKIENNLEYVDFYERRKEFQNWIDNEEDEIDDEKKKTK